MKLIHKICRKFVATTKAIKEFPSNFSEFGIAVATAHLRKAAGVISAPKYINSISDYMQKELAPVINRYNQKESAIMQKKIDVGNKFPVFICWFQGEENMPDLCHACLNNLRKILPQDAQIHFITYDNYLSYIDVPQNIVDKFKKGAMCPTNYSDIIRYALLATYGGAWIDAAIYLSEDVFEEAFKHETYTPRFYREGHKLEDASRGRWVGGCWLSKNSNVLFKYVYDSLIHFWNAHNKAVEYLAVDYIIWSAYCNIKEIKQLLDNIPINNEDIRLLNNNLAQEYTPELFEQILKNQKIHLINRHKDYPIETKSGKKTIYGHILSINKE